MYTVKVGAGMTVGRQVGPGGKAAVQICADVSSGFGVWMLVVPCTVERIQEEGQICGVVHPASPGPSWVTQKS